MEHALEIDFGPLEKELGSFQRIVSTICGRYARSTWIPFEDLHGHAVDGMIRAVARFEPGRGTSLQTWVYRNVVDAVRGYIWEEKREPARLGLCERDGDEDSTIDTLVDEMDDPYQALLFREFLDTLGPDPLEIIKLFWGRDFVEARTPTQIRVAIRSALLQRRRTAAPRSSWSSARVRRAFRDLREELEQLLLRD